MIEILLFYLNCFVIACDTSEKIRVSIKNREIKWYLNVNNLNYITNSKDFKIELKFFYKKKKRGWWFFNDINQKFDILKISVDQNSGIIKITNQDIKTIQNAMGFFNITDNDLIFENYGLILEVIIPERCKGDSVTYLIDIDGDGQKDKKVKKAQCSGPYIYRSKPFWFQKINNEIRD